MADYGYADPSNKERAMKHLKVLLPLSAVVLLAGCGGQLPARYLVCDTPQQFCYRANSIDHEYTQFHYGPRGAVRMHQDQGQG